MPVVQFQNLFPPETLHFSLNCPHLHSGPLRSQQNSQLNTDYNMLGLLWPADTNYFKFFLNAVAEACIPSDL